MLNVQQIEKKSIQAQYNVPVLSAMQGASHIFSLSNHAKVNIPPKVNNAFGDASSPKAPVINCVDGVCNAILLNISLNIFNCVELFDKLWMEFAMQYC